MSVSSRHILEPKKREKKKEKEIVLLYYSSQPSNINSHLTLWTPLPFQPSLLWFFPFQSLRIPVLVLGIDMGTAERSRKKVLLYRKAIVHFLLCFVMGFFTGFAPTGKSSIFSTSPPPVLPSNRSAFSPEQTGELLLEERTEESGTFNRKLDESEGENSSKEEEKEEEKEEGLIPRRLIILVTPTRMNDKLREVNLRRLSNTLRLVPPPFLWVVVEQKSDSSEVSEILRKTGIMYRHVVFRENFTDPEVEMDHQRNLALNHIEHHRLSGIVHFAGLSNVYDLQFFDEIRAIE